MKFLVIAPTPFFTSRGTHIRILEEALALERRGHAVTIATYHIGEDIPPHIASRIDVRRIRRWLFWYKKLEAGADWQKIILDLLLLRKVLFLTRTQRPDVIYAHLHEGALIGKIAQTVFSWRKMRLVVDFHGSLTGEMHSHGYLNMSPLRRIFAWLERKINGFGDIAVASSWEYARSVDESRRKGNTEVLLDGVNIQNYLALPSRRELRARFDLPHDKTVFVYAGAFLANKGIHYLVDAIEEMARNNIGRAYFVLAGSPSESIEAILRNRGLEDHVRVICPLSFFEMPALLAACDIGIDPKDSDTAQASGKILQYMAAGLPVLCFDRDNNHRYLGEGAYYVRMVSSEGLAQGLWYILKSPDEISRKGRLNFEAASGFSWDNGARKIDELLAILDGTFAQKTVSGYTKSTRKF